jgi:putative heme-binding domain-containing protein
LSAQQSNLLCDALAKSGPVELMRLLPVFTKSDDGQLESRVLTMLASHSALASLDPTALRKALQGLGPQTNDAVNRLVIRIDEANQDKLRLLNTMLEKVKHGDPTRGQQIFFSAKASCSTCHAVGAQVANVGPGLGGIGRVRSERDLLEAVLFPSASFVRTFEPVVIDTKDGVTYNGIIKNETESELELAVDATKRVRIPLNDIERRAESKVSIMPAGLDKQMTPEELADLIAFLKRAE